MNKICNLVEEQASFSFTGRLNILDSDSNEFLGAIFQREGKIVHATFGQFTGKRALWSIVASEIQQSNRLKYIVEPEVFSGDIETFQINAAQFRTYSEKMKKTIENVGKVKPPGAGRFSINSKVLFNDVEISPLEFDVLCATLENRTVDDIYKNTNLLDHEITEGLISLRKKKVIKASID